MSPWRTRRRAALERSDEHTVAPYLKWLRRKTNTRVVLFHEPLSGPTQFGEIYEAALRGVKRALGDNPPDVALAFHLSPGTPAMAAVWILLGKTRFPAELIESSRDHGVRTASVPFDISADTNNILCGNSVTSSLLLCSFASLRENLLS